MAGRPSKPSALKLIEGNRGKRATGNKEPEPALLQDLEPPAHLTEDARKVWAELAPKLRRAMVLTELDTQMLEMTCDAIATYRMTVVKTDNGKVMARNEETGSVSLSPWVLLRSMAFKQAYAGLREFGATPTARSKVMVDPQADLFAKPQQDGPGRFFK